MFILIWPVAGPEGLSVEFRKPTQPEKALRPTQVRLWSTLPLDEVRMLRYFVQEKDRALRNSVPQFRLLRDGSSCRVASHEMLEPTNIGQFGRATFFLTTPDDHGAFDQLLDQLNCPKDTARISSDAGDLFGSDVSVSMSVERILRPAELSEEFEGPDALLLSEIVITDVLEEAANEEHTADFADALRGLASQVGDSQTWDVHCHLVADLNEVTLPAPLPIDLWNTGVIGTLIGCRFQLDTSAIDDGSMILDIHQQHIHATLNMRCSFQPTVAAIATLWDIARNVYDDALVPVTTGGPPHVE